MLARAYREYQLVMPRPGWVELRPEHVWHAVVQGIREVAAKVRHDPLRTLTVASLGEACMPVATDGTALGNSILSLDNRARSQWEYFTRQISPETLYDLTGLTPLPHYTLFKLMWWRDNEPALYDRTWKFLCYADYIGFKLGQRPTMDHTLATRTLAFEVRATRWSLAILGAAGLDASKLPDTAPPGTIIGELPNSLAADLDLPPGVKVVLGGLDQACAALGAGVLRPRDALLSLGTAGVLGLIPEGATRQMRECGILTMPHVVSGTLFTLGGTLGGGSVLRWYRDQLGAAERAVAASTGQDVYDVILASAEERPTRVLALPHLAGSRFAFSDPTATGVIIGLTLDTTRGALIRALLEGVAYEFAIMRERFQNAGLSVAAARAVGGGSSSNQWMQIIADGMQIPVHAMRTADAAALGAALLGATALGEFDSLFEAAARVVQVRKTFEPAPAWASYHAARLALYLQVYDGLKDVYSHLPQAAVIGFGERSTDHDS